MIEHALHQKGICNSLEEDAGKRKQIRPTNGSLTNACSGLASE